MTGAIPENNLQLDSLCLSQVLTLNCLFRNGPFQTSFSFNIAFSVQLISSVYKFLLLIRFKLRISSVGSNHFANFTTTVAKSQ